MRITKAIFFLGVVVCLVLNEVYAVDAADKVLLEDEANLRNLEEARIKRVNPLLKLDETPAIKPKLDTPDKSLGTDKCIRVMQLYLDGDAGLLSYQDRLNIYRKYLFQCIELKDIKSLISYVQRYYLGQGYITTKVSLGAATDFKLGQIYLDIKLGKLEAVRLNKNKSLSDKLQSSFAFFNLSGKTLKMKDLEQGLDQLNRLSSHSATMKITQGRSIAKSIVDVKVARDDLNKVTLKLDDGGAKNTGKHRHTLGYSRDNLFGVADSLSLSYQKVNDATDIKFSKSLSVNIDVPLGYWNFSYNTLSSDYSIPVDGKIKDFISNGNTRSSSYSVIRTLARINNDRLKLSLSHKNLASKNYIDEAIIDISSSAFSSDKLKLEYIKYFKGGYNIFNLGLTQGEYVSGAPFNLDGSRAKKFSTLDLYNKYNLSLNKNLSYSLTLSGQKAISYVGAAQRFALSSSNVRGFSSSKSYFNGFSLQNNFSFSLLPRKLTLNIFYDIGYGFANSDELVNRLEGAGVSLSYSPLKYVSINYEYAKPVFVDSLDGQGHFIKKQEENFSIKLSYSY